LGKTYRIVSTKRTIYTCTCMSTTWLKKIVSVEFESIRSRKKLSPWSLNPDVLSLEVKNSVQVKSQIVWKKIVSVLWNFQKYASVKYDFKATYFRWKFEKVDHAKSILFHGGGFSKMGGFPWILWQKLLEIAYCFIWDRIILIISRQRTSYKLFS
jgi:hypothetical protein